MEKSFKTEYNGNPVITKAEYQKEKELVFVVINFFWEDMNYHTDFYEDELKHHLDFWENEYKELVDFFAIDQVFGNIELPIENFGYVKPENQDYPYFYSLKQSFSHFKPITNRVKKLRQYAIDFVSATDRIQEIQPSFSYHIGDYYYDYSFFGYEGNAELMIDKEDIVLIDRGLNERHEYKNENDLFQFFMEITEKVLIKMRLESLTNPPDTEFRKYIYGYIKKSEHESWKKVIYDTIRKKYEILEIENIFAKKNNERGERKNRPIYLFQTGKSPEIRVLTVLDWVFVFMQNAKSLEHFVYPMEQKNEALNFAEETMIYYLKNEISNYKENIQKENE